MANYLDYEYDKKSDPKEIIVWEQNYETRKIEEKKYKVSDYMYFYIDAIDEDQVVEEFTSQRGTRIQRVEADDYKTLRNGDAAQFYHGMNLNTYESDIEPIQKAMLDNYGEDNQRAPTWNLALYDIETDVQTEDSFMDMRENANREINAVSVWYSKPNKFYNFTVVPPTLRDEWDFETVEVRGNFEIMYFDNEKDMLEAFFEVTKMYETVALGAWNGDFFDTKYVFDRCKLLWKEKGAAARMGRFGKVRKTKIMLGEKEEILVRPVGMIWYDCLEAYKKNGPELESFALNAVAEEELGTYKIDFGDGDEDAEEINTIQLRIDKLKRMLEEEDYEED
jgi:DNA polymerase elongation subunit (family B)